MFTDQKTKHLSVLPMGKTGNNFNIVVAGSGVDAETLVAGGMKTFKELFHEMCKLEGVEVVELPWISVYR